MNRDVMLALRDYKMSQEEEYTKELQRQVLEIFNKVKQELGSDAEIQLISKEELENEQSRSNDE
jgi:hypothetical protein